MTILLARPKDTRTGTYSVVARDPETGAMGVAVQTHQVGVGRVVPWCQPGVGVVATQSLVNTSFGPMGLEFLRNGVSATSVIAALVASDASAHRRQLAVVDARGGVSAYTGEGCIREAGHYVGDGYSVQANMMAQTTVVPAMRRAYEGANGDLAERMMAALRAAQAAEGDIRGMQSASLKIVSGDASAPDYETLYDLRIDEHENPVDELDRLVVLRRAQLLDNQGHQALRDGRTDEALQQWKEARRMAPSLEELGFWQAVALADINPNPQAVSLAARIMEASMLDNERVDYWLDLVRRLDEVGLIERQGAGNELLEAYANL